jgi:hypothetical protein
MKKLLFFLTHFIIGLKLIANPIPIQVIVISELYFDNDGNWKLELAYYDVSWETVDSVFLCSKSDTIRLPDYSFTESSGIFVITADSLLSEFRINRNGDKIIIVAYIHEEAYGDILIFGNYHGASIDSPRGNQSISKYQYYLYANQVN